MRAALAAALVLLAAPPAAGAATETVAIPGRYFDPARLTVAAGDTVVWRNHDAEQHTVIATGGSFASATLATHGSFAQRFDVPGGYPYMCTLHAFMTGWIEVAAAAAPSDLVSAPPVAVRLSGMRHRGRLRLTGRVRPAQPGAVLALELHFRDRFAWRQVAHRRLGRPSTARFAVRGDLRRRARLVLHARDGGRILATSRSLRPWTIG
jgi:plastocyanin